MHKKQLLITVGTTKFEQLIKAADKDEFYQLLIDNQFTHLIIQKGSGEYIPNAYLKYTGKMDIKVETILNNFEEVIKESELIISHGGAGIILESLKNKRKVIVCVNDLLMDNHQKELASSLDKERHVHYATNLEALAKDVEMILKNRNMILDYPEFNYDAIPNLIYKMLEI